MSNIGLHVSETVVAFALPIFILCPAVAMYFGGTFNGIGDIRKLVKSYFLSPIFLAVILGLALSRVNIPAIFALFF